MGSEFKWTTLGHFAKVQGGYAYKSSSFVKDNSNKVLKIKNVRHGVIYYGDCVCISDELAKKTIKWKLKYGDILISMTGSGPNAPQSLVGRVARVWKNEPKAWINQRVGRLQLVGNSSIHPDFLFYLLSLPKSQEFLVANATGSANQANINNSTIELLPCPKVTFEQSTKIAKVLVTLDEKIILSRQINQTLEQMAQALFKSWFIDFDPVIDNALAAGNPIPEPFKARAAIRQKIQQTGEFKPLDKDTLALFPAEFKQSDLGWVPFGWCKASLSQSFDVLMGQSPPSSTYNQAGIGLPFYQGKADFDFRFPKKRVYCTTPKRLAQQEDTLVSVRAPVGDINLASEQCAIGRGVAAVRHKTGVTSYTYYLLKELKKEFQRFDGEGTVFGNINQKDFKNLLSIKPTAKTIDAFESIAKPIDDKLSKNLNIINSLTALRDTLLPKLISGELKLPDNL